MRFFVMVTLATVVVLGVCIESARPQTDAASLLVGKWEGDLADSKYGRSASTDPSGRTLVIKSAAKVDGKWSIDAVYGITGRRMAPVAILVAEAGDAITLLFTTGAGSQVNLRLSGGKTLVGVLKTRTGEEGRRLILERVATQ